MNTSTQGIQMEATASIKFKFRIAGRNIVQERELNMEEFIKNPEEYGGILRSAWFHARNAAAAAAHKDRFKFKNFKKY